MAKFSMTRHLSHLVGAQVEINRAVWAGNAHEDSPLLSFQTEEERKAYMRLCAKNAIKSLQEYLKKA